MLRRHPQPPERSRIFHRGELKRVLGKKNPNKQIKIFWPKDWKDDWINGGNPRIIKSKLTRRTIPRTNKIQKKSLLRKIERSVLGTKIKTIPQTSLKYPLLPQETNIICFRQLTARRRTNYRRQ